MLDSAVVETGLSSTYVELLIGTLQPQYDELAMCATQSFAACGRMEMFELKPFISENI